MLFAREVDCDPHASVSGMLFQEEWLQACVKVQLPDGRGLAGYDPAGEGQCEPILCLRSGNRVTEFRRIDGSLRHRAQEVDRLVAEGGEGRVAAQDPDEDERPGLPGRDAARLGELREKADDETALHYPH